jgi:DNA-binding transcriptional MerR regulator
VKRDREKLYYSISEVSEAADVKAHVLRYWETQFRMLKPKKNRAGNRMYRPHEMNLVLTIRDLLYRHGFTIAGAKRKLLEAKRMGNLEDGILNMEPALDREPESDAAVAEQPEAAPTNQLTIDHEARTRGIREVHRELTSILSALEAPPIPRRARGGNGASVELRLPTQDSA